MNRIRLIREKRPFAAGDLIVYCLLAALIIALFVLFLHRESGESAGVRVEVRGEEVYRYEFGVGGRASEGADVSEEVRDGVLYVRIGTQNGYNLLCIDEEARTVSMADADCSRRKDCTQMRAIGNGGEAIVCIPHSLRVVPLEGESLSHPSVGSYPRNILHIVTDKETLLALQT